MFVSTWTAILVTLAIALTGWQGGGSTVGAQEPKTEPEIAQFCQTNYGVTFPMTAKQKVVGADAHGLYQWISGEAGEAAAPRWNFHQSLSDMP